MNESEVYLWNKLSSKKYREAFVAGHLKQGIPFQIRSLLKSKGVKQEELAERSGLTQGAISRAASLTYGNLTLNTIIRIAAGFDIGFIGKFVSFGEMEKWYAELSEDTIVKTFPEESKDREEKTSLQPSMSYGNVEMSDYLRAAANPRDLEYQPVGKPNPLDQVMSLTRILLGTAVVYRKPNPLAQAMMSQTPADISATQVFPLTQSDHSYVGYSIQQSIERPS